MSDRTASSADVAAALRLSGATIQLYARRGRIPFDSTPGGHRRFDVGEVQAALLGAVTNVESEIGRRRPRGLGGGGDRPTSENANLLRDLHSARPESRATAGASGPGGPSALGELVAHARSFTLTTVSA